MTRNILLGGLNGLAWGLIVNGLGFSVGNWEAWMLVIAGNFTLQVGRWLKDSR